LSKLKATLTAPLLVLVIFVLTRLSLLIEVSSLGYKENIFLSAVVMQLMIFCLPAIFYCRLKPHGFFLKLRLRPFGVNKIFFIIVAFLAMVFGSMLIKIGLAQTGLFTESAQLYESYFSYGAFSEGAGSAANNVYIAIALALVPAICEEFVFRSVLLTEYRAETKSVSLSVIFSSLLFAMMHFSLSELPIYFFCGVVLSLTALVTRSVLATVIMHFANNIISIFFESYILNFIGNVTNLVFFIFLLTVLFLLCCILLFGEGERIYYNNGINGIKSSDETNGEKSTELVGVLLSPTFLLCIIFFFLVSFGII